MAACPSRQKSFALRPTRFAFSGNPHPMADGMRRSPCSNFRNRRPGLSGHNLYFWIFAPAADLRRRHAPTRPLHFERRSAGRRIPRQFQPSNRPRQIHRRPCPPAAGSKSAFHLPTFAPPPSIPSAPNICRASPSHQGRADNVRHTLIVDEIRVADEPTPPISLPAPTDLHATGYDRHIELEWNATDPATLARYVIYRSEDGGNFTPVGIQIPGIHRYEDFLGKSWRSSPLQSCRRRLELPRIPAIE